MFGKLTTVLLVVSLSAVAYAKAPAYPKVADSPITVRGEFVKHDKNFVFLQVKGAKNLVKVRSNYLPNSPLQYERKHRIEVTMPLGRYLLDNPVASNAKNSKKKSR